MSLRKLLGGVFASSASKNQGRIYMSKQVVERLERQMEEIQRAQDRFARAIIQYSEQLKSHTDSIEGLSQASRGLAESAAEQNKVLIRLIQFVEQTPAQVERIISEPEEEIQAENTVFPPGCCIRR